jgi:hypothetical protein
MKAITNRKHLPPNLSNFISSFREIGYMSEVAIADIIDNSISAKSTAIKITALEKPYKKVSICDNGCGMSPKELDEAMRLSSKSPDDRREKSDLGRFGLGLKVASFSQCKKLTVFTKTKDDEISGLQWDLDYIAKTNDWYALIPDPNDYIDEVNELSDLESGTQVIWEDIDKFENVDFREEVDKIINHLGLVFHKYIEGIEGKKLLISINNNHIKSINPFYYAGTARQKLQEYTFNYPNGKVLVTPYILPHHNKVSEIDYNKHALGEGYLKTQGFYLYRNSRLVTWGNWWGLAQSTEALRLVRIEIEIPNTMDSEWNIDLKKSTAKPPYVIRQELKNVLGYVKPVGKSVYSGRIDRTNKNNIIRIWDYVPRRDNTSKRVLKINRHHPLVELLQDYCSDEGVIILNTLLIGLEQYLPIETIISQLISNPKEIDQATEEVDLVNYLNSILRDDSLSVEQKADLLKTEFYKNE